MSYKKATVSNSTMSELNPPFKMVNAMKAKSGFVGPPNHSHSIYHLNYIFSGKLTITFKGEKYEISSGKLSLKNSAPVITFKRAIYPGEINDGVEIKSLTGFNVELHVGSRVSKLNACEWVDFSESIEENRIVESYKIAATSVSFSY